MRHAKSDWNDPRVDDHDRPLNARGIRDAPEMAARLAATAVKPTAILSSTALRARTTAAAFGDQFGLPVTELPDLYGASGPRLLQTAEHNGSACVIVVAHDPGMTMLASRLSGGQIAHMPTCAVATFTWNSGGWDVADSIDPDDWSFDAPR